MASDTPRAQYDPDGNLYATFPPDLVDHPLLPLFRHTITSALPVEGFDWEPYGDTLRVGWQWARDAERTLRTMYPDIEIVAAANPAYGHRPARLAERAAQLMGAGR